MPRAGQAPRLNTRHALIPNSELRAPDYGLCTPYSITPHLPPTCFAPPLNLTHPPSSILHPRPFTSPLINSPLHPSVTHLSPDPLARYTFVGETHMATIQLDQRTAERLTALATASGMTIEAYLQSLLPAPVNGLPPRLSPGELNALLNENSFDGPALPADFSRADIYDGHA